MPSVSRPDGAVTGTLYLGCAMVDHTTRSLAQSSPGFRPPSGLDLLADPSPVMLVHG
jgi:hypothetical protein